MPHLAPHNVSIVPSPNIPLQAPVLAPVNKSIVFEYKMNLLGCIDGCETCNDGTTCNSCMAGYYKDSSNKCIVCPTDTASVGGTTSSCPSCGTGKFAPSGSDACYSNFQRLELSH